jgi:hypothetical protein
MINYETMYTAKSQRVADVYGDDFLNICVDAENCGVKNDNSQDFWQAMVCVFDVSVGMQMAEAGISNEDMKKVGVYY